jgi:hypothetical protein
VADWRLQRFCSFARMPAQARPPDTQGLNWWQLQNLELELRGRIPERVDAPKQSDLRAWRKTALALLAEFVKSATNVSWLELCEREYFIRDRLLRGPRDDADPDGEMLRGWWAAVQCLLLRYAREMARPGAPSLDSRGRPAIFPPELAARIAGLAGYLAVGSIPSPISEAATVGRPAIGPSELQYIGWAVAYRDACRPEGIEHEGQMIRILDPAPIRTLTQWYGVRKRTVQGWLSRHPRAFLGVNSINAEVLTTWTQRAGRQYRLASTRSTDAIARRQAKR